jgi:hypothetical protein
LCRRRLPVAEIEVAAHLANRAAVHRPLTGCEPREQRVVADHADRARNAVRPLVDQRHRLAREHLRADAPSRPDPPGDVAGRFLQRERPELAAQRDALLELPQRLVVEQRRDLGLAGHDHREQLALVGLDVGEQPDLFEDVARQALCLVDQQYRGFAGFGAAAQHVFELQQQRRLRLARPVAQLEAVREHLDELGARERRVLQMHAVHARRLPLERGPDERRLAGPRLAHEQRDAGTAGDAVLQVAQRLPVNVGHHQETRVRRQVERTLAKAVEGLVHSRPRISTSGIDPTAGIATRPLPRPRAACT